MIEFQHGPQAHHGGTRGGQARSRFWRGVPCAALVAIGLLGAHAAADAERGVLAANGDKLTTSIGATDDVDAFTLELAAGGQLRADAKAGKDGDLLPTLRLFDPMGVERSLAGLIKREGTSKPLLSEFDVPAGTTGVWTLTVESGSGSGPYTAGFKIKTPTKGKVKKLPVATGAIESVPFVARTGALLTLTIKNKSDGALEDVRVIGPGGKVEYELPDFTAKGSAFQLKKAPLSDGFGAYRVELTGPAAGAALVDVASTVKLPKIAKRKLTLGPEVTLSDLSPMVVRQGDAGRSLTLSGSEFSSGSRVEIEADGVSVAGFSVVGSSSATLAVDVADDAEYGPRDVTYVPPVLEAEPVTLSGAILVEAPQPTVSSASPTAVLQEGGATTIEVTGTGFRVGGSLSISGGGLIVGSTQFISPQLARVTITAASDAPLGARDVTWTQPAEGGGAVATGVGVIDIHAPTPVVTTVAPAFLRQGDTPLTLTVTGSGFREGGALSISGSGLTLGSTTVINATSATVVATAATDAALGDRVVTFTHSQAAGGGSGSGVGLFAVRAPLPTLTSISPSTLRQGDASVTVTLTGTGFRSGGSVTVAGDGVSSSSPTFVSPTSFEVDLNVASDATLGLHDVTYVQPAGGGAENATLTDALRVNAPIPTVTSTTPTFLRQGTASQALTVTGTGFRSGGALSISGAGLTLGSTTVTSASSATVIVTVDAGAGVGGRDITFTQAAGIGGASGVGDGVLSIRHPEPTIASVAPTALTQGDTGATLTLTGTGFRDGGSVSISGSGLFLSNQSFVSSTSFQMDVDVAPDADLGALDITYTQPLGGGGDAVTLVDALQIDAPDPTISAIAPTFLRQGDVSQTLTLTGTGFSSGGAITLSGNGLTLGSTNVVSSTQATVSVSVNSGATVGTRDVTFTQPAIGGGAATTSADGLDIQHPVPTISSVTPTGPRRAETGTFTLTGSGFRSGGTVTTDATDVALSNPAFVSDTSFTVAFSVDGAAALGDFDLTYTQPSSPGGGAAVTKSNAYTVLTQGPTLSSISPDRILPGTTRTAMIVTGSNYASGAAVTVSGSGVTVHSTTVDSSTQLTLVVSAASDASLGARNVTITPSSGAASTFTGALRVIPADPTVTGFGHGTLAKGASGIAVTVAGTNFRSGATLSASGAGVTFTSVTVSSASQMTATAAVAAGAATGLRSITVAHATADGGGSGSLSDALRVIPATPTITSLNPSKLAVTGSGGATRTVPVTITGTNFMSGAAVTVTKSASSGVTVVTGSVEAVSDTSITCELSVTGTAATGLWDLKVTNPGSLGNSGTTGNSALDVKSASSLTVNRVFSFDALPHGGERVTIHGGGFAAGDVVDFGTARGYLCQVIDQNTLLVTVPQPSVTSATAATTVDVKVTPASGSAATLTGGYTYPTDTVQLVTQIVFPTQGATGVPQSLRSACVKLTAPLDTSTVTYGTTTGTNAYWFESGSYVVSGGQRAFGPQNRWLVFTRSTTSALPINNAGTYIVDIPAAAESIGGTAFVPTRVGSTTHDQQSFSIATNNDTTAPTVTRTPANSATGVSTTTSVKLVFNEEMDPQYIRAANITLKQGSTTIATVVVIADDLKTVYLHPETELVHSTTYTVTVTASVKDLHGNAFSSASSTFTTGSATDTTNPTIDSVVIEDLPSGMDGSTTYVSGNDSNTSGTALTPGSSQAFDLLLPQSGFELLVTFSDEGGAGIDPSTFSAKCSAAIGSSSANAELASNFDVTSTRASWRLGVGDTVSTGDNVTFTFSIQDQASNSSSNSVVTVDVLARTTSTAGNGTGDLDPFNSRDHWVLRTDLDAYTPTFTSTSTPSNMRGATTTQQSDNVPDFAQALELVGLNSSSPTSASQSVSNANDTGTNAIMRRLVIERIREVVRERFEIEEDGTRDSGSVNIDFLLAGEQGGLTSLPTYGTSPSGNSSTTHNEMSIGGTDGAESNAYAASGTLGRANYDARNSRKQRNIDNGSSGSPVGLHLMGMMKLRVNGSSDSFRTTVATQFVTIHGGTPVGEHASDDDVLAGSFDRTTSTNTTHSARHDAIMDGIESVALYVSAVLAHETGHSLGLAPDSAPKTGLFGWAHRDNSFTEATTASPNTSSHLNFGSPRNIMAATISYSAAARTGTEFMRFNPLYLAHLRRRVIYDEGR